MDRQDDEFESLLRQFQLREPRPLRESPHSRTRVTRLWLAVAAAIAIMVLIPATIFREVLFHSKTPATIATGDGALSSGVDRHTLFNPASESNTVTLSTPAARRER